MAATTMSDASTTVEIPPLDIREIEVTVRGLTPLIIHKWSEKQKKEIREKQAGKKVAKERAAKNPKEEFDAARYRLRDGRDAVPAIMFKMAMVRAAKLVDGITMTDVRTMFNIADDEAGLIALSAEEPEMREDPVRIAMGKMDLRYRPQYTEWSCLVRIRYNAGLISPASLLSLLERAGAGCGIGEWRPNRNGIYGTFTCIRGE